jgi:chemotaxis protein histidine kinase CheA
MFFRRRRARAREREHQVDAMQRLLEQFERLRTRVEALQGDLTKREAAEAALLQQLRRAEAELANARDRIAALHELVGRLSAEAANERERRRAAEARPSLHEELAPLWTHLAGQRELLAGLAARLEHAVRPRVLRELPAPTPEPEPQAHVLFLTTHEGYELYERDGVVPGAGTEVALGDGRLAEVVKVGPSPLPGDRRRCAYAQLLPGLEPPAAVVRFGRS